MQTKDLHATLSPSHDSARAARFLAAERTRQNLAKVAPFGLLSARRSTLRQHEASLALLLSDREEATLSHLTHSLVEQRLRESARLVAELLELAERADEQSHTLSADVRSMGEFAEECFDAILRIDAVRQDLSKLVSADGSRQHKQRREALRAAREVLTTLDRQLAQALSN